MRVGTGDVAVEAVVSTDADVDWASLDDGDASDGTGPESPESSESLARDDEGDSDVVATDSSANTHVSRSGAAACSLAGHWCRRSARGRFSSIWQYSQTTPLGMMAAHNIKTEVNNTSVKTYTFIYIQAR